MIYIIIYRDFLILIFFYVNTYKLYFILFNSYVVFYRMELKIENIYRYCYFFFKELCEFIFLLFMFDSFYFFISYCFFF